MPRFNRGLQACKECRKRKIRCDGSRPRCHACTEKARACSWHDKPAPGGYQYLFVEPRTAGNATGSSSTAVLSQNEKRKHTTEQLRTPNGHDGRLPALLQQRLIDIFANTHHNLELCGCILLDNLKETSTEDNNRFLLSSIFALSSLYLTNAEAKIDTRFEGSVALMMHYRAKAQAFSRASSDQPTVVNIHANLVLGLCELLTMATSKAWLHLGLAIRMAQTLRMRRENNSQLAPRERELRRRTFWSCIILDCLVAYCTFRTQTIDQSLVELHLPCSDNALAFGHDLPGPKLSEFETVSDVRLERMTLAHFTRIFLIWSQIARMYVNGGRRIRNNGHRPAPISSAEYEASMKQCLASLPSEMTWSAENLKGHQALRQDQHYISMHLLIQHSFFLAHHEYLPYFEDEPPFIPTPDKPSGDNTPQSSDVRVITACLEGAANVVAMLRVIESTTTTLGSNPIGICAGIPIVTSASVLLWTYYYGDRVQSVTKPSESQIAQARSDVDYLLSIVDSWAPRWSMARAWAKCIRLLDEFHHSRCHRPASNTEAAEERDNNMASAVASPTPLRDGDGFPDASMIPRETYYKVRLITGLIMEQPALCKRLIQQLNSNTAPELEYEQLDPWDMNLDISWPDDFDVTLGTSFLWPENAF